MVVFRPLSGRQIDPIANLAIALRQVLLSRVRARTLARGLSNETDANEYINNILILANQERAHTSTRTYAYALEERPVHNSRAMSPRTTQQCRPGRHCNVAQDDTNRNIRATEIPNRKEDGSVSGFDCALSGRLIANSLPQTLYCQLHFRIVPTSFRNTAQSLSE